MIGALSAAARPTAVPIDNTANLTDEELLALCREGQQRAWNRLIERYQRLVFTVPRRAGLSEAQAADVFQTTFTRLVEQLHRLADPSRVQAWLVTTARRESLHVLRLAGRQVDLTPLAASGDNAGTDPLDRFADPGPLPETLLGDLQQQHRVHRALAQLDARSRRFVELLFLQDEPLPYNEIARRLNIAEGSIGPTRARCLAKLRTLLERM